MLERAEGVPPCFLREPGGGRVGRCGQVVDGPDRHLLGPCGQAAELEIVAHPLVQWRHGSTSCTYG